MYNDLYDHLASTLTLTQYQIRPILQQRNGLALSPSKLWKNNIGQQSIVKKLRPRSHSSSESKRRSTSFALSWLRLSPSFFRSAHAIFFSFDFGSSSFDFFSSFPFFDQSGLKLTPLHSETEWRVHALWLGHQCHSQLPRLIVVGSPFFGAMVLQAFFSDLSLSSLPLLLASGFCFPSSSP